MKRTLASILIVILAVTAVVSTSCEKKTARLLYWNIQNGMWSGQDDNYNTFASWVKGMNPDICVFAEAQTIYINGTATKCAIEDRYLANNNDELSGWRELAGRYGHKYVFLGGHRDNYPQVITSKYPIIEVERITGNTDTLVSHGAGWAKIKVAGKEINVVTLHTWPQAYSFYAKKEDERAKSREEYGGDIFRAIEMEYICKHTINSVPGSENQYWMMMGDFNSKSQVDTVYSKVKHPSTNLLVHKYIIENTPYKDVIKETRTEYISSTAPNKYKSGRIDFVYLTEPLLKHVTKAEIIWDDYTTPSRAVDENGNITSNFWHPSDHLPIVVDFSF
ncbi:MAG: endonuclease [Bacteroidales bacterium]|nr:endonuclease [Bacteroidales bacterium]